MFYVAWLGLAIFGYSTFFSLNHLSYCVSFTVLGSFSFVKLIVVHWIFISKRTNRSKMCAWSCTIAYRRHTMVGHKSSLSNIQKKILFVTIRTECVREEIMLTSFRMNCRMLALNQFGSVLRSYDHIKNA